MLTHIENQTDYNEYKNQFNSFFEETGIEILSQKDESEPYFSHLPCDCCMRPLGGDRYDCSSFRTDSKEQHEYSICVDCLYFKDYGQLDDMTMLDYDLV